MVLFCMIKSLHVLKINLTGTTTSCSGPPSLSRCMNVHPSPIRNGCETGVQTDRKTNIHFRNNTSRV